MGSSSDDENSQLNRISSQFFVPASLPASPTDETENTQDYLTAVVKKSLLELTPQIEEEEDEDSEPEVVYPPLMDLKNRLRDRAAEAGGASAVLVADSEVEGGERSAPSEGAVTIEETVSEESADMEGGATSNDTEGGNTTVILKESERESKKEKSPQSTQEDMFKGADSDEEERLIATPSRHLPNLQLSAEPMLVPETVEESMDHVCPSPEACGLMPVIMPSCSTQSPPTPEVSSHPDDVTALDGGHNPSEAIAHASRSQTVKESQAKSGAFEGFGQSQDLHLYLTPSQDSVPHPSVRSQVSALKEESPVPQTEIEACAEELSQHPKESMSVKHESLEPPVKQAKVESFVHTDLQSESQSYSQTTFTLEKPREESTAADEGKRELMPLNIFQRTRLGLRGRVSGGHMRCEESSEDLLAGTEKECEQSDVNSLSSDSDIILCSQDVKRRRPVGREKELVAKKTLEMLKIAPTVEYDAAETLVDSPLEINVLDDTQAYLVSPEPDPALTLQRLTPKEERQADCPTNRSSHAEGEQASQKSEKDQLGGMTLRSSQRQTSSHQQEPSQAGLQGHHESQKIRKEPDGPGAGETNNEGHVPNTGAVEGPRHAVGVVGAQFVETSSPADRKTSGTASGERERERNEVTGDAERGSSSLAAAKLGTASKTQESLVGQMSSTHQQLNPDPFHFAGSQSQLSEAAHDASRSDISAAAPKRGRKVTTYRHKQFVKKKNQPHLITELSSKSSSADETARVRADAKSARRTKRLSKVGLTKEVKAVPLATDVPAPAPVKPAGSGRKKLNQSSAQQEQVSVQDTASTSAVAELVAAGPSTSQPVVGTSGAQLPPTAMLASSKMLPPLSAGGRGFAPQPTKVQSSASDRKSFSSGSIQETRSELQKIQSLLQEGRMSQTKSVRFSEPVPASSSRKQPSLDHSSGESQSSDSVFEETLVKEVVMQYIHRTITVRHISLDGKVLDEKVTEEKGDPVVMEENLIHNKKRMALLSPSCSGGTISSGDLADISSSSLSSRKGPTSSLESNQSSLELPVQGSLPAGSRETSLLRRRSSTVASPVAVPGPSGQSSSAPHSGQTVAPPACTFSPDGLSPDQSTIARDESHIEAIVTSSSCGQVSEPLYSADNLPQGKVSHGGTPVARPSELRLSSSSSVGTPPADEGPTDSKGQEGHQKTASHTCNKSAKRVAADSSQSEGRHNVRTMRDTRTIHDTRAMHDTKTSHDTRAMHDTKTSHETRAMSSAVCQLSSGSEGFIIQPSSSSPVKNCSGQDSATPGSGATVASGKRKMSGGPVASGSSTSSSNDQLSLQVPVQDLGPGDIAKPVVQITSKLTRGAKIMARWKDGFFYPATFEGLNTGIGNKFWVKFEDGIKKTVRAVDMIMAQHLPIGQSVLVNSEDGTYDPGIIVGYIIEGSEIFYSIAMDDGSNRRCNRKCLLLTEDQASCLLSDEEMRVTFGEKDMRHLNTADVSLDNILCGHRLRSKDVPALPPDPSSRPSTSSAVSGTDAVEQDGSATPAAPKEAKQEEEEADGSAEKEPAVSTQKSSRKRKVGPVATSTPTPKHRRQMKTPGKSNAPSISPVGGVDPSPQKQTTSKGCVGLFEKIQGPLPSQNLFAGLMFLLTHTAKYPETLAMEKSWLKLDSSTETSATCDSNDSAEACSFPFDKHRLQEQLENGGGVVLDRLNPGQVKSGKNKVFLISDTYQRTAKYLQCLAAGVLIVSHQWIMDSCKQDKLLDYRSYLLPAGISLEKHKVVERNSSTNCLYGHRILLTSSKPDFLDIWTKVLELSHCKILPTFPTTASKNRPFVDVVVTDETCIPSILKKAKQFGVPVVGSEWIIQCLINNHLMSHTGHERYAYDYYKDDDGR